MHVQKKIGLRGLVSLVVQCLLAGRRPCAKRPSLYPAFRELRGGALLTQAQRELSGCD